MSFLRFIGRNGREEIPVTKAQPLPLDVQTLVAGVAMGAIIAFSDSASVSAAIPNMSDGTSPYRCRFASTKPCYIRLGSAGEISAAMASAGTGYAKDDTIVLDGGVGDPIELTVATTRLISAAVNAPGTGYAINNTVTLAGGTAGTPAVATVTHIKAVSATVAAGGSGGTPGTQTVTGTTGTGTKFQASVTVSGGGAITAVLSITVAGDYTVGMTDRTQEPVTGASLTGAQLNVVMGVHTVSITTPGSYTVNSTTFTQASTNGSGTGLTLNTGVFGVNTVTVSDTGDYSENPANPVAQDTSSGAGTGATFTVTYATAAEAGDMLIQPGDSVILDVENYNEVACIAITDGDDGILSISPLEN